MSYHSVVKIPEILPNHIHEVLAKATCLYSKNEVEAAFHRMAIDISDRLSETNPIFLCVVIGGIIPLGNLLPRLNFPLELDYVHVTRYLNTMQGQQVQWLVKPRSNLKNRTVIIVDDILDGGITLNEIVHYCHVQEAKEIYTAVLVDKPEARLSHGLSNADFYGLQVENYYVFGYGMDYKGYLRNAPGIYMVAPEHK